MGNMWNPHRAIAMMVMGLLKQGRKASYDEVWKIIEDLKSDLKLTPGDIDLFSITLSIFETYPREVIEKEAPTSIKKYLETEEGKRVSELLSARGITL